MSEEEIEDLEQEEQEVAVDLPESSFIQRYKTPIIGGIVGTLAIVLIVVFVTLCLLYNLL